MSKKKLIKQLKKKNPNLNHTDSENIVNVFFNYLSNALSEASEVEFRGFGRWYCKKLKQNYNSRNPLTNELIYIPERIKMRFKASKKLNKFINE